MTEAEWTISTDPCQMLTFLEGKVSNRKFWLFACGCCREHPNLTADARCRTAVETGERYADGKSDAHQLMEASEEAFCRRTDLAGNQLLEAMSIAAAFSVVDPADRDSALPPTTIASTVQGTVEDLIRLTALSVAAPHNTAATEKARQEAAHDQGALYCRLMRCVTGNPFRPVTLDSAWLTRSVKTLAQAIYDDRAFDGMPVLGDALEEEGCSNQDILSHCRGPGPHVRGCWVVDLVLGKE